MALVGGGHHRLDLLQIGDVGWHELGVAGP